MKATPQDLGEVPQPTPEQLIAATLHRVAAHFTTQVWSEIGLVVLACDAADRAGQG